MKQTVSKRTIVGILFFAAWLAACQAVAGQVSYHPPGIPLQISVNTWGELEIEVSVGEEAVIAVFQAAVHQSPGESTPLVRNKYLARGRVVTIVKGPVCAERVLFWKVRSGEIEFAGDGRGVIIGWVAEESGDIYLLMPWKP